MKMLHKLLAVLMLGVMAVPVGAGKGYSKNGKSGKGKTGQCATKKARKPMTDQQKAKAKARREARKAEKQAAANS